MTKRLMYKSGFTLLEVMVALAVFAITAGALWKGMSGGYFLAEGLPDRMLARWVANNLIIELQAGEQWPNTRVYSGSEWMGGRQWYWEQQVSSTDDPMLRRVNIRVGKLPGQLTLANLEGYLRRPRPPVSAPRRIVSPSTASVGLYSSGPPRG